MEHVTALVDHDATTTLTCGCERLVATGWKVNCSACGRVQFTLAEREEGDGFGFATTDGWDGPGVGDSNVEPCDVERDDDLSDAAERWVA